MTTSTTVLIAQIGAAEKWARCPDRSAATAAARKAFADRFEREVDPDGILSPDERAIRAGHAKTAYYRRMALAGAQARKARAKVAADIAAKAAKAAAELAELDAQIASADAALNAEAWLDSRASEAAA